jgi:RNA polymerase sigma-70 factor (ECF subfamily)
MASNLSDQSGDFWPLVLQAKNGDREALGKVLGCLQKVFKRQLEAHPLRRLRSKVPDSDVIQEINMRVCEHFAQFHGDTPEELHAWLWAIVKSCQRDQYARFCESKRRQIEREVSLSDPARRSGLQRLLQAVDPSPEAVALDHEAVDLLHLALDRLPANQREVVEWHYWDGLSFAAIAECTGHSAEAVRQMHIRAIDRLRTLLGQDWWCRSPAGAGSAR